MEIFLFYNSIFSTAIMFGGALIDAHFIALIVGFAVWAVLFILQGFALRKMAKERGISRTWMAFVPFVNYLFIGKLAGTCSFFGQKIKRTGVLVMVAQIVATLLSAAIVVAFSYLLIAHGEPMATEGGVPYWDGTGFAAFAEKFYYLGVGYNMMGISLLSIFQLIYEILLLILMMTLYRQYAPKAYGWLSILVVFIPWTHYIVLFCLRNREHIDFEAYIRARREALAREYQQRYGGGYGTPYGGFGYGNPTANPYGNGAPNGQATAEQPPKPEDPFAEFDDKENTDKQTSADDDGFFA